MKMLYGMTGTGSTQGLQPHTGKRKHKPWCSMSPCSKLEVVLFKHQHPPSLSRVELFGLLDCDEILVIHPDRKWVTATLEPLMPFLQCPLDGQ